MFGTRHFALVGALVFTMATGYCASAAVVGESVMVGAGTSLALGARYFRPTGNGPFPAIVVLHGVGGLWANDNPAGGVMNTHFEEWAQLLAENGYASLFVDSYTARGLVEYDNRRPAADPALDDSICSPAYERPKDVFKALVFLQARGEIKPDRIGLLAFSQGAETALSSLLSPSVTRSNWTVSYLNLDGSTTNKTVPAPTRLATGQGAAPGFKVAVVYYPGCGFYNYFGSPSSTNADLYMPYAPTLIQHGNADPLYSGSLYPEKMVLKSGSQAAAKSLAFNPLQIVVYTNATHSFDEASLTPPPVVETSNQTAKRLARPLAMRWFDSFLKQPQLSIERADNGGIRLRWPAATGATYNLLRNSSATMVLTNYWTSPLSQTSADVVTELPANLAQEFFILSVAFPGVF